MKLRGATALVTGAAGGLGDPIARGLAAKGARLVISDLPGDGLDARTSELRAAGIDATPVSGDLLVADERATLIPRAEEAVGPLDVLVNNAGIEITAPFVGFTDEELDRMLEVNLVAPMALTRAVLPGMLERRRGHVVQIASLAGKVTPGYMAPYGIAKAGLVALTQSLRAEYADQPVGFSAICPGFISGRGMIEPMLEAGTDFPSTAPITPPERVSEAVARSIEQDLPEMIFAHRRPMRLVVAMYALAPRLTERMLRATGVDQLFRKTAEYRGRL
jgi:NAD(P)-dependent dehydrogenase (short-subunit alcohol dehydrogenase family)